MMNDNEAMGEYMTEMKSVWTNDVLIRVSEE
jgi:hypothetical protein